MSQLQSYDSLSTARINRLLRPLRNRCSVLSASDTTKTAFTTTYSTNKSFTQPDISPLSILSAPENATSLNTTSYELSRKIYAVRNAFKDVVEKTSPVRIQARGNNSTRIPSLTTLCSLIIGQHADPEIEEAATCLEQEQSVDIVEALYEEIPVLYRGWTLVSHSLSIILNECPLSPTLLRLLLDITLDNNLPYHSEILLRNLLSLALSPSTPTRPPPICHSAHSNFLVALLNRWKESGNTSCGFFRTFNEVMDEVRSFDSWTCKAILKLFHVCRKDPLQLIPGNLVRFISKPELHLPSRQFNVSLSASTSHTAILRRSLRMWLDGVLRHLLLFSEIVDFHYTCDFLLSCREYWAHLGSSCPEQDPVSGIVSLATLLLSRGLERDEAVFVQVLSEQVPSATTVFSPLTSQTFASFSGLEEGSERIELYAFSLRKRGFLRLEALLWASALREVENWSSSLQRFDKNARREYLGVLIDRVEEVERQCYGGTNDGLVEITNSPSIPRRERDTESSFGSPKRRKRHRSDENSPPLCYEVENEVYRPKKRTRASSFLLSKALFNRVVLHEEKKHGLESEEELKNEDEEEDLYMASDDGLDLFAYPTSSPARS